jgi:hypothetical protein
VIDLEPPCRCLGQEGGRVRCAVVFIVARGLTSFLAGPAQHSVTSVFWIFAACESAPLPLPRYPR